MPPFAPSDEDNRPSTAVALDARCQDDYWSAAYCRERYFRPGCDYEDYAPAYCVGYVGFAQYGGEYESAERSLCANWERIKGASRLTLDEARVVFRAAWDRLAREVPGSGWSCD